MRLHWRKATAEARDGSQISPNYTMSPSPPELQEEEDDTSRPGGGAGLASPLLNPPDLDRAV